MNRQMLMALLTGFMAAEGGLTRAASDTDPLRPVRTIPLPGVQGRIDHLAVDVAGQRLFVAALGNNTVEVIDLQKGQRVRSVGGFKGPAWRTSLSTHTRSRSSWTPLRTGSS